MIPTSLEAIEEAREKRDGIPSASIRSLMLPGVNKGRRLGKRPISREGTLNQNLLSRSPGSRIPAVDFVKAVYSDRTGQEGMY